MAAEKVLMRSMKKGLAFGRSLIMHLTIRCIFDKKGHLPDNRVSKDLVVQ
jgi:hypothetical protein